MKWYEIIGLIAVWVLGLYVTVKFYEHLRNSIILISRRIRKIIYLNYPHGDNLVKYSDFYGTPVPVNPIELIPIGFYKFYLIVISAICQ